MHEEIKLRLADQPFKPFTVHVADGREFHVPTPDHAHIHPNRKYVSIYTNAGLLSVLPMLLLSGVTVEESYPEPSV